MASWHERSGGFYATFPHGELTSDPARGLTLHPPGQATFGPVLGLEVVSAANLAEPLPLVIPEQPAEMYSRQGVLWARYPPAATRNVECQARWELAAEGRIDLEVSALTPGMWQGLAVVTCSYLPAGDFDLIPIDEVGGTAVLCRPTDHDFAWLELCHPHDGHLLEVSATGAVRFRLFEHDLEKGVILRGRLRGQFVPKSIATEEITILYGRFLAAAPNLSL